MEEITEVRTCSVCMCDKVLSEFYGAYKNTPARRCKKCANKKTAECRQRKLKSNPQFRMFRSSKARARIAKLEHSIKPNDIPLPFTCKYLGIVIDYFSEHDRAFNSPSIDRIDSSKGYTPDNIQVISLLANRMKTNSTNEQLVEFAKNVLRFNGYEVPD